MIRRQGQLQREEKEKLRDGMGTVIFDNMLEPEKDEFYGKGRLFSILTLKPGCSIGYHVHTGEMEVFHILSGEANYNDNGAETVIRQGDTTITLDGEGHSVENRSDKDLTMAALILFSK